MAVYREYDQAGLDAQYNNRAAVAEAPQFIARWEADSEAVRQAGGPPAELAYGDHPRHTLDVFAGPGVTAPTLVFIHGGYWHMLAKTAYHFPAPAITGAGINYVALEYPLAPEVTIGDIVASVRQGIAWLWRNGSDHGLDPDRLYVSGHSAGGHLTAMAMASDWAGVGPGLPDDLLKAGLAISGLFDMEPIRLSYLNKELSIAEADVAGLSPMNNLAPRRLDVVVGGAESDEYLRQAREYHQAWAAAGGTGRLVATGDDNHFSVIDGLDDPKSELFGLIKDMCGP